MGPRPAEECSLVLSSRRTVRPASVLSWAWRQAALVVLTLLCLLPVAQAQTQMLEGGTVKGQHGDWQIVCKAPPPGARTKCVRSCRA